MATKSAKDLVAEASQRLETLSGDEALRMMASRDVVFVDIREAEEIRKTGTIKNAVHVPRGFLEFQADPASPTHRPELSGKKLVLFCGSGRRSALGAKALTDMGIPNVAHVAGGFPALQQAGAPREEIKR